MSFYAGDGSSYQIWCLTFYLLHVEGKVHEAWKYHPDNRPTKILILLINMEPISNTGEDERLLLKGPT